MTGFSWRRGGTVLLILAAALADARLVRAEGERTTPQRRPYGIERRVPWTTSKVIGSPDPPAPFQIEVAFPKVRLAEPLAMEFVPGTNQWAVAERHGKIFVFANEREAEPALMLDVGRTVYGFAFHPQFAKNGYLYVSSVLDVTKEEPRGSRVSRFTVTSRDPLRAAADSEQVILEWPSGGHNGGCVRFGPDGYLYLGTGDGSGIADGLETGQDLSDLLAAMLRIDVDHPDGKRPYSIPADNPFVNRAGARPEIWAYGLRQPWKFAFDHVSGRLWCGEIGQDIWEEVLIIEKGGNYGWSLAEANHPFLPERKVGPTPPLPALAEHHHAYFRSITGGYVYRGERLPKLRGSYIYGDYDTGKIWELRYDSVAKKVSGQRELVDTQLRVIDFGQSPDGDVVVLDFMGQIYRLVPAPPAKPQAPFPHKLSETGLFANTKDYRPAAGLIPYSVNSQLWSDGAHKDRFLALPGNSQIDFETVVYPQPAPGASPGWQFPDGTVLVKTFYLDRVAGRSDSRRRLETRLLHYEKIPGTNEVGLDVWRGYTYVWNDEQTDAELLGPDGLDREFVIEDPAAPEGKRKQTWHFPSRAECTLCHTMPAKSVLGVTTLQFNRDHDYDGVVANQMATLEHLGIFSAPLPKSPDELPRLVDPADETQPLEARARSYLHANCSHCHRKWGGGNADFQLLATLPLSELGAVNTRPGQGAFGLDDPRIIAPGRPERTLVLFRMQKTGLGRMPHIASNLVDQQGVRLIADWLKSLPEAKP